MAGKKGIRYLENRRNCVYIGSVYFLSVNKLVPYIVFEHAKSVKGFE